MAVVNLVKSIYTGSDVTSLGEIASGDTITIPAGSTIEGVTPTGATGTAKLVFNSNPTLIGTKETKVAIASSDIDLSTANYFSKTISTATTFTVSNTPTTGTVASFVLDLTDGGADTVDWWTGVQWAGGTAPTLTASGRDVLGFFTYDGGTTWTGLVLGLDIQ